MIHSYLIKNLKSLFTKQRLLSLLLVLNIAVSCLVICFSYGLYQNYNAVIDSGALAGLDGIDIEVKMEYLSQNPAKPFTCDVTLEMMMRFINSLSDETVQNIECFVFSAGYESNVYVEEGSDTGYYIEYFYVNRNGDKIIPYSNYIDSESYANGEKVAYVGKQLFDNYVSSEGNTSDRAIYQSVSCISADGGRDYEILASANSFLPAKSESIIINGEEYKILDTVAFDDASIHIPCTSLPLSTKLSDHFITVKFKDSMTLQDYSDVCKCASDSMGAYITLPDVDFTAADEIYYYKTIMLISAVIALLAAINMAILYRYILEKRSSELAILRICGCSRGRAVATYLCDCLIMNVPIFILTELAYHKLIMPRLSVLFPHMAGAYSLKLYVAIATIYVTMSVIVMLVMICNTVHKHSLVAIKNTSKSTGKAGVMKLLETIQLATVITILILAVSVVLERQSLYKNFEDFLDHKGYMVAANNAMLYYEDFMNIVGDAKCITNEYATAVDGDSLIGGIAYSDEFINAYSPPIKDGVWLNETDETYENSGYVPIVLSYCEGRYKVGDTIENEYPIYNENDEQTGIFAEKYRVVGILEDNANIACYWINSIKSECFTDIYDVFNDEFNDHDFMLTREKDIYSCYNSHNLVWGTQFVYCDDMTESDYIQIGQALNSTNSLSATPLSEVYENSKKHIYEQMYTLFPIAVCIFILTVISTVSISAIYTKRQLRNYAILYICGARWRSCALRSLRSGVFTCLVSSAIAAAVLVIGKLTFLKETVISFGIWHLLICLGVIVLYLLLAMIMPLSIIGSSQPREVVKEE